MLRIVPLGGLGEIGLNSLVVDSAGERVLVDAGLLFPGEGMPGVDYITPDFSSVLSAPEKLGAVLLTHGHEDHIGALPELLRDLSVPVYGAPFTLALVRARLEEYGVSADLREIAPRQRVRIGERFTVEAIQTCHSMPDALGYALETPEGTVLHTGDYKLDPDPPDGRRTDLDRYAEAGDRGVLCLFADSTNSDVLGSTGSEREVARALERVTADAKGRVVVSMFASNVVRVQSTLDAAARLGRKVALGGRSMVRNVELAKERGLLRVPDGLLVSLEAVPSLPKAEILVLTTGSQAEPRSGLVQMSSGEHVLQLEPGDLVVLSALPIPGNERAVASMIDALSARGARVLHAGAVPDLHVSGHATPDQQRQVIAAARPRCFVPIHGELHHLLAHLELARGCGVPEEGLLLARDGDILELDAGRGRIAGHAPAGRLYKDLFGLGHLEVDAIAERVRMGETGVVVAAMAYDRSRGQIASGPTLEGRGLSQAESAALAEAASEVRALLSEISPELLADEAFARGELARAVRRAFKQRTGKRPAVIPVVLKL